MTIEVEVMTVSGFEAWAAKNSPRYSVIYCVADTTIAVAGLTYQEAWRARDLHSVAGKTAWVEPSVGNVPTYVCNRFVGKSKQDDCSECGGRFADHRPLPKPIGWRQNEAT